MGGSLNPLRCDGTALPPQLLLMAKLAVLCLLLNGEAVRLALMPDVGPRGLGMLFLGAAALVLTNRLPRLASVAAGASAAWGFSTPSLYPAGLLMLAGLYRPGMRVTLALRGFYGWMVWSSGVLYVLLLWATGRRLGVVDASVLAVYLIFAQWPREPIVALYDAECGFCAWVKRWWERLDGARVVRWVPLQAEAARHLGIEEQALRERLHALAGPRTWSGFAAFRAMVLYDPKTYFAAALIVGAAPAWLSNWLLAAALAALSPLAAPVGEAVYDWVARNRRRIPPRTCRVDRGGESV
jgi:predicted DCC family thiol-disulfide oxidoreductase YuxK